MVLLAVNVVLAFLSLWPLVTIGGDSGPRKTTIVAGDKRQSQSKTTRTIITFKKRTSTMIPNNDETIQGNNHENIDINDAVSSLRKDVRPTYREIDRLYSDDYLAAVLEVSNRPYEYARDEKIIKALEWRRSYGVDALMATFRYDDDKEYDSVDGKRRGGIFRLVGNDVDDNIVFNGADDDNDEKFSESSFIPSQSLVDVCLSGSLCFKGFDKEGRGILYARAALLNWWRTGVEEGIQYHVLVIEHALKMIAQRNSAIHNASNSTDDKQKMTSPTKKSESMILYVDSSNMSYVPPPLGTLTGLASLLQRAYPDRIHKIYVGPVNVILRTLYDLISQYLRPRLRDKIVFLDCPPNLKQCT